MRWRSCFSSRAPLLLERALEFRDFVAIFELGPHHSPGEFCPIGDTTALDLLSLSIPVRFYNPEDLDCSLWTNRAAHAASGKSSRGLVEGIAHGSDVRYLRPGP